MDITVTTPLEMGMGQQKYVVAYTLKQGVEKQPDILNAQQKASSMQSIKDIQKMGSPVGIRPDALVNSKSPYGTSNFDQKSTPSSKQSTLKRNHEANNYSLMQQSKSPMMEYEKPYNYTNQFNHFNYKNSPDPPGSGGSGGSCGSNNLDYDKNLDYRLLNISQNKLNNHIDSNNINSKSPANPEYRYSGSEFVVSDLVDYSNASTSSSNLSATLTKSRNRNHIITDTLPGPESCV